MDNEARIDGWQNAVGGLGSQQDKHLGLTFAARASLTRAELDALYRQNAIVARVVDRIVDDALRTGWELTDVKDAAGNEIKVDAKTLQSWLSDLRVDQTLKTAGKWSRLYGGALVVLPLVDQKDPTEPATKGAPMLPLVVLSGDKALPLWQDAGIFSPTYGRILEWDLQGIAGAAVRVHHSRVIPMEAVKLPIHVLQESPNSAALGWGPSVVERMFDDLGRDGAAASHAVSMMYTASLLWLKIKNYAVDRSAANGRVRMQERAADMQAALNAFSLLMMDTEDELGSTSLAATGAGDLMDRTRQRLAAATEYPKEILFNEVQGGLNAGELSGPQEIYFAAVDHWRNEMLTPVLDVILEWVFAWKGIAAASWCVEWNPLWTKSEAAIADVHLKNAQADTAYEAMGAVTAEEIRSVRFMLGDSGGIEVAAPLPVEPLPLEPAAPAVDEVPQGPDVPQPDDAVTIQAAAARLGLPTASISAAIRRGELRYWGIGARKVVSLSELASLLRKHETPVEPAPAA
jgi:phage-related protein (TIGR01555 family)